MTERAGARWLGIAASWSSNRSRWRARYHYGPIGFAARTSRARALERRSTSVDVLLQAGATFDGMSTHVPGFVYCDAHALLTARHAPYGDVGALREPELQALARRERTVYASARLIFTMSDYLRQSFIADLGLRPDRIVTVHGGANLDVATIRARPPRLKGPPTVLFVGRQWERKGGPDLLAAFRQVREALPDARLRIVGCTPDPGGIPGVEVWGPIVGAKDRLNELYRSADLFCLPSRFEPFGAVFVEAMLHGVACLGTTACAMPEIIEDGVTGWLVPVGNSQALAARLTAVLQNRAALAETRAHARERALRQFTWDAVATRIVDAITAAAQSEGRPMSQRLAAPRRSRQQGPHPGVRHADQ